MDQPKKRPGRPRKYFNESGKDGAPSLNIRFDPALYDYVHGRPEGARQFLEQLVQEHLRAEKGE